MLPSLADTVQSDGVLMIRHSHDMNGKASACLLASRMRAPRSRVALLRPAGCVSSSSRSRMLTQNPDLPSGRRGSGAAFASRWLFGQGRRLRACACRARSWLSQPLRACRMELDWRCVFLRGGRDLLCSAHGATTTRRRPRLGGPFNGTPLVKLASMTDGMDRFTGFEHD